jgi:hypothetical protein
MLQALILKFLKPSYVIIILLVSALGAETYYIRYERAQWNAVKAAYEHPKTIEVVKVVRELGPATIRTVVVEKPSGEKTTTTIEEHGPSLEQLLSGAESTPVPVNQVNPPPVRQDRWLGALSLQNFTPRLWTSYTIWGGYSFQNRFDLLYGLNYKDGINQQVMGVVRF